ncbi:MAG: thiosulfate oxidation carrier complex protein SoxZ [Gammaproteobacteria bacterium]|jgi:sulfur-oxidizing protein SoxZ
MNNKLYIKLPEKVEQGDLVFVRVRIDHEMESGWRITQEGNTVPKNIIREFICLYNGKEVFKVALDAGMSPNPYIGFYIRASESGNIDCTWVTGGGERLSTSSLLTVI